MTAAQALGPETITHILFVPWFVLYLARLRNAGRSAWHVLHVVPIFALVLTPVFVAPDAFATYTGNGAAVPAPSTTDTLVFLACMLVAIAYYLAFAIWLGCIRPKAPPQASLADTFA